jgi:hypothetical protein
MLNKNIAQDRFSPTAAAAIVSFIIIIILIL